MKPISLACLCCAVLSISSLPALRAETGELLAVFVEPSGCAIETMGGFRIAVGSKNDSKIEIGELINFQTGKFQPTHILNFNPAKQTNHWTLDRQPNQLRSRCRSGLTSEHLNVNRILIYQRVFSDKNHPSTWIETAGVTVCDLGTNKIADVLKTNTMTCDVIIATGCPDADNDSLSLLSSQMKPRYVLLAEDNATVSGDKATEVTDHNFIAVSSTDKKDANRRVPQWIKISDQPWKMSSSELTELFERKEASAANSRAVFAPLSVAQMNFVPGDGSHTPRWNSEHMMGRELLFFSQIYHAIDPEIPVMNLNPKQMPTDYVAAHADWTGQEEALLTLQVQAFTRRFAYLLKDLPLDKKTKGSKMWSPRGLLEQMERHYDQHTENVKRKMKLENWPKK
jgi:hypothetical protein